MPQRILVPLDGSKTALHALPPALALAERTGARIFLATAAQTLPPLAMTQDGQGTQKPQSGWFEEERKRARMFLSKVREEIGETQVEIEVRILSGRPAAALEEAAEDLDIDLIVMTSHGRGRVERFWLGSVTDGLVRSAPCPVLVWRPGWTGPTGTAHIPEEVALDLSARPTVSSILVPLDGSDHSESILPHVQDLANAVGASLSLLAVVESGASLPSAYLPDESGAEQKRSARIQELTSYLEGHADRLRSEGFDVEFEVVRHASAADAILESRRKVQADLVALATRGRGGVSRLLTGSVADKVIRAGVAPVLTYRPG